MSDSSNNTEINIDDNSATADAQDIEKASDSLGAEQNSEELNSVSLAATTQKPDAKVVPQPEPLAKKAKSTPTVPEAKPKSKGGVIQSFIKRVAPTLIKLMAPKQKQITQNPKANKLVQNGTSVSVTTPAPAKNTVNTSLKGKDKNEASAKLKDNNKKMGSLDSHLLSNEGSPIDRIIKGIEDLHHSLLRPILKSIRHPIETAKDLGKSALNTFKNIGKAAILTGKIIASPVTMPIKLVKEINNRIRKNKDNPAVTNTPSTTTASQAPAQQTPVTTQTAPKPHRPHSGTSALPPAPTANTASQTPASPVLTPTSTAKQNLNGSNLVNNAQLTQTTGTPFVHAEQKQSKNFTDLQDTSKKVEPNVNNTENISTGIAQQEYYDNSPHLEELTPDSQESEENDNQNEQNKSDDESATLSDSEVVENNKEAKKKKKFH